MPLFSLHPAIKDAQGVPYTLMIQGGAAERERLKQAILSRSQRWNEDFPIDLIFAESSGSGPIRFLDLHFWDLGRPSAFIAVVSPAFRALLERFCMPDHAFYPITIGTATERQSYFLLHLIDSAKTNLVFLQTPFHKYALSKVTIPDTANTVFFADHNDYLTRQQQIVPTGHHYESDHYVYPQAWDIFWGSGALVLINDAVKQAIEQAGLTGVALKPFTAYTITMLPQG